MKIIKYDLFKRFSLTLNLWLDLNFRFYDYYRLTCGNIWYSTKMEVFFPFWIPMSQNRKNLPDYKIFNLIEHTVNACLKMHVFLMHILRLYMEYMYEESMHLLASVYGISRRTKGINIGFYFKFYLKIKLKSNYFL